MALFMGILFLGVFPFILLLRGGSCGMGHSIYGQIVF